ncbi:conserved hypothetical protein; putative secreted protein [Methylobacterium sp. 4-46]|uniref:DUF4174 domain-containing protein n=1 Tax=unclassified Methylobacterium TaxID=2615210 RepID=UPI000165CCDE|nr:MULTISPECIES: DUF4174 domain-containing protein [Methylobacterium]ACA18797.1 conserved hypothetical protein; putative secreted protein [Methylobacterium sp. 4-46]WFT78024.1 DUF4174 domain-containing protein [Methylobacterium nodulans]
MILTTLLPAALAAAALAPTPAAGSPLDRYRWKARLLVVAATPDDPRVAAQRRVLARHEAGAAERNLVLVEAVGAGPQAAAIRRALALPAQEFRAVLVGKDGTAKLRAAAPIPAETLFATIDAMPMRRDEAGRR